MAKKRKRAKKTKGATREWDAGFRYGLFTHKRGKGKWVSNRGGRKVSR